MLIWQLVLFENMIFQVKIGISGKVPIQPSFRQASHMPLFILQCEKRVVEVINQKVNKILNHMSIIVSLKLLIFMTLEVCLKIKFEQYLAF